jgi:hypothetical protein
MVHLGGVCARKCMVVVRVLVWDVHASYRQFRVVRTCVVHSWKCPVCYFVRGRLIWVGRPRVNVCMCECHYQICTFYYCSNYCSNLLNEVV